MATNEAGSASKEFNVTILVPPNILDRHKEQSVKARAGVPVTLHCNVYGVPTPTILWQRNGMYLTQNSTDVTIMDSGLLIIQNVTKESSGAYTCEAENMAGITQRFYYLQVNCKFLVSFKGGKLLNACSYCCSSSTNDRSECFCTN